MADGFVQVFPDSTGKQIDTETIGSVHRQRIRIGGVGLNDLATVTNNRLDVNVKTVNGDSIAISHPGTAFDISTEEGSDGAITLDGSDQTLAELSVPTGTTAHLSSISFTADKKCTFRVQIIDGSTVFKTKRLYTITRADQSKEITFPVPIEVTGTTGRKISLIVKKTDPDSDGLATGAINGYTTT